MTIRVIVIEDDPILAEAHEALVERVPGYTVVGRAYSGKEALHLLATCQADLLLLDVYLPDMTGLDVLRTVRAQGWSIDAIAVTSARDLDVVRAAVTQGVVQYLLKPFTFAALREKLEQYARYRREIAGPDRLEVPAQRDIDRVLAALRAPGRPPLPKGMSEETLAAVVQTLRAASDEVSAAQVAGDLGISRVTARRYLEHLAEQRLASRSPRYGGAGRPEYFYAWVE